MNKENNVVVKLEQHNSNRQIGLEAYEKLARNFMNVLEEGPPELEKNFQKFLDQGNLGKRPENDKRKAQS